MRQVLGSRWEPITVILLNRQNIKLCTNDLTVKYIDRCFSPPTFLLYGLLCLPTAQAASLSSLSEWWVAEPFWVDECLSERVIREAILPPNALSLTWAGLSFCCAALWRTWSTVAHRQHGVAHAAWWRTRSTVAQRPLTGSRTWDRPLFSWSTQLDLLL